MTAAALARSLYHLLDRHRLDEATDLLDAGFRGHGLGSDRAGFRAEAAAWIAGFPDLSISIRQLVTDGSVVATWLAMRGTHRGRFAGLSPTDRRIELTGADLLVARDGRFVEAWSLRDLNALWTQLGALPDRQNDPNVKPRKGPTMSNQTRAMLMQIGAMSAPSQS